MRQEQKRSESRGLQKNGCGRKARLGQGLLRMGRWMGRVGGWVGGRVGRWAGRGHQKQLVDLSFFFVCCGVKVFDRTFFDGGLSSEREEGIGVVLPLLWDVLRLRGGEIGSVLQVL